MRSEATRCDCDAIAMRSDAMRCDTIQYSIVQYSTVQYNTTQHNTIHKVLFPYYSNSNIPETMCMDVHEAGDWWRFISLLVYHWNVTIKKQKYSYDEFGKLSTIFILHVVPFAPNKGF